ncbi:hypothetical protein GCM10022378_11450 [Salinicoccus jeotgali]|uniref:Phage protein n=1 Tax=Salinicoccus jeotgali TaxID=381634 RepID=A0ABP7ER14_9STAP
MSEHEYPYLEKAVKYYEERFERRNPIRDERDEYNDLKTALRKAKAFDEIVELEPKNLKYVDRPHLLRNQIMDIIWQYESEELE